jgi:hypothetical protein
MKNQIVIKGTTRAAIVRLHSDYEKWAVVQHFKIGAMGEYILAEHDTSYRGPDYAQRANQAAKDWALGPAFLPTV